MDRGIRTAGALLQRIKNMFPTICAKIADQTHLSKIAECNPDWTISVWQRDGLGDPLAHVEWQDTFWRVWVCERRFGYPSFRLFTIGNSDNATNRIVNRIVGLICSFHSEIIGHTFSELCDGYTINNYTAKLSNAMYRAGVLKDPRINNIEVLTGYAANHFDAMADAPDVAINFAKPTRMRRRNSM